MTERRLTTIAIINRFGHWLSTGLVVPVLAIFQIDRGLSLSQVGINGAVYACVIAVMEIPTGGLADTLGRRNVYALSLLAKLLSVLLLAFAFSPLQLAAGFALMGFARALSSGSMDAYFIDAFGDLARRGSLQRFLARVGASVPLSLAIGGLLGGLIPDLTQGLGSWGPKTDRYSLLFVVAAAVVILQTVLTFLLVPARESRPDLTGFAAGIARLPAVVRDAFRHGISNRIVLFLLIGSAAWGIAFAGLEQFWQPFVNNLTEQNSPTRLFGYLTTGYFLVGALGALAANVVFRVLGPRYGHLIAALRVAMGSLFVLLSLTEGVPSFAVVYLALFFFNGVIDSPEQALFNSNIPRQARSTMLSFQSLFMQLGGGMAAVAWGLVSQYRSISLSWQICGAIFALSGVLYLRAASPSGSVPSQSESE